MSYKDIFKPSASSESDKPAEKQADKPDTPEGPAPAKDSEKSKS